jgi:hypothetical protein
VPVEEKGKRLKTLRAIEYLMVIIPHRDYIQLQSRRVLCPHSTTMHAKNKTFLPIRIIGVVKRQHPTVYKISYTPPHPKRAH